MSDRDSKEGVARAVELLATATVRSTRVEGGVGSYSTLTGWLHTYNIAIRPQLHEISVGNPSLDHSTFLPQFGHDCPFVHPVLKQFGQVSRTTGERIATK
jgi:hypothetical protein